MKVLKSQKRVDNSTEEKIKRAARTVFHRKGFAGTRTREIAAEAGINLALLNYYFRSKEQLFKIIMMESWQAFFQSISTVFNNESSSFEAKINTISARYLDTLQLNPEIPLFLMSELRTNPNEVFEKINTKQAIMQSTFIKQFEEGIRMGKIAPQSPIHFIMNLMSLLIFPFVASPMFKFMGSLTNEQFNELMEERKKLIPSWIKACMAMQEAS